MKRWTIVLMMLIAAFALTATSAYAGEGVKADYWEKQQTKTALDCFVVNNIEDKEGVELYEPAGNHVGWFYVKDNKTFNNRLNIKGDVHLILGNNKLLQAKAGINVPPGSSLTIYCQSPYSDRGILFAADGKLGQDRPITETDCAAIGGNEDRSNGQITVEGGWIIATANDNAAGIGGGNEGHGGGITINDGKVEATGGYEGAGIGGGDQGGAGTITINGGEVTAKGGITAAGIGGGDKGDGGNITITGGKVNAKCGSTDHEWFFYTSCTGAAIGGGHGGHAGKITIRGGEVNAHSWARGAAIGSGGDNSSNSHAYNGSFKGGEIIITGGNITADPSLVRDISDVRVSDGGAGIGSGADSWGVDVQISGGNIRAYASYYDGDHQSSTSVHFKGLKGSACIGNGYSAETAGRVIIRGNETTRTYIETSTCRAEVSDRQASIGAAPNSSICTVQLDYPGCRVDLYGQDVEASKRLEAIQSSEPIKIIYCEHDKTKYEGDASGHWKNCKQCGATIEKTAHDYAYVHDEGAHWQRCSSCGYETAHYRHSYDEENGKCVCGVQGVSLTVKHGDAAGKDWVEWFEPGEKVTIKEPTWYKFEAPAMSEFQYYKINDSWKKYDPGFEVTLQANTTVTPVYQTSWNAFKAAVEGASNGSTVILPSDCRAPEDDKTITHIIIEQGKKVTIDLKGHMLDRAASGPNNMGTDGQIIGFGDGDVIVVKGELTVIDSSDAKNGEIKGGHNLRLSSDAADAQIIDEIIGAGGITVDGGTLNLTSGGIVANSANGGGGVGVYNNGTFNMTGGIIESNMFAKLGSGVYVDNGTFNMTGGKISNNFSVINGSAGVQLSESGTMNVSGSPVITGNKTVNAERTDFATGNVRLENGQTITVAGALTNASIGVITAMAPQTGVPVKITKGGGTAAASSFICDTGNAIVSADVEGTDLYLTVDDVSPEVAHTITVNSGGHGKAAAEKSQAIKGTIVNLLATPDEGYQFKQWTVDDAEATVDPIASVIASLTMGSKAVKVTAEFEPIPVSDIVINMNVDGVEIPVAQNAAVELPMGKTIQLSADVSPEVVIDKSVTWETDESGIVTIDKNGNLKAVKPGLTQVIARAAIGNATAMCWIAVSADHTITFDANGGEGANDEVYVANSGVVSKPDDPVRENYEFLGWYQETTDPDTGKPVLADKPYDFSAPVTSSFTLKAQWEHLHNKATLKKVAYKAPTCTEDGNAEYWQCSICDKTFIYIDDGDTTELEEVSDDYIVIPAGHTWSKWTSTGEEQHERTCTVCKEHETSTHFWNDGEITEPPTTEAEGVMTYTCKQCGQTTTQKIRKLNPDEFSITTTRMGAGTVIANPKMGKSGAEVRLEATPAEGYKFVKWEITGRGAACAYPEDRVTTLTIGTANVKATAIFEYIPKPTPSDDTKVNMKDMKIIFAEGDLSYTGEPVIPVIDTIGGIKMKEGTDYTVKIMDSEGNVVEEPIDAGTYTLTVTGKGRYTGSTSADYTIGQAKGTLTLKAKKPLKVKTKKLTAKKKVKIKFKKAVRVSGAQGTLTYKKVKVGTKKFSKKLNKKYGKYIKVKPKTGKIIVKKGLKKGLYKVRVKVTDSGNANYGPVTKKVVFKIRVK